MKTRPGASTGRHRCSLLAAFSLGACLLLPALSRAEPTSPEAARVEVLSRQALSRVASVEAAEPLEALWAEWDVVGPTTIIEALEQVEAHQRADPWVRALARWHLAEAALRRGRLDEARRLADDLGVVRDFLILGPLDNEGDEGLERQWPPEAAPAEALALDDAVAGTRRPVSWRAVEGPDALGLLRFEGLLDPSEQSCVYAAASTELDRAQTVQIAAGASGALTLWVDGALLLDDPVYRGLHPDRGAARLRLAPGLHRVLAKVCGDESPPALLLRITDASGSPLGDAWTADAALAGRPTAALAARAVSPLRTPFQVFWERSGPRPGARREPRPSERLAAARFLHLVDGDDPGEPRVPELAAAAVAQPLTVTAETLDDQLLAAAVAIDRNAARQRLEVVTRRLPVEPRAITALARLVAEGPCPTDALALVRRARALAPRSVEAVALEVELLELLGLAASGLALVDQVVEAEGSAAPRLLELGAELARGARRPARARELWEARGALRQDDLAAHRALVELDRDRRDSTGAATHIAALAEIGWWAIDERIWASGALDQIGHHDEAEGALRQLTLQAPQHHDSWAALGRLLVGQGRREEAIPPLRRSLELQPQEQETRELLAHLLEQQPFEDRLMEAPSAFLARRGGHDGEHAQWLVDLTVVKVHRSGLSSRFRQIAVEILDEEGASDFRTHGISFVPEEQQVTVRRARVFRSDGSVEEASGRYVQFLSEPAYRMYYDERAEVIELPRLRPGDVVEFAYRVDDVATTNVMGSYFGDIPLLQGFEPRRRVVYALIHPQDREVQVEVPEGASIQRSRDCGLDGEGSCTLTFEAVDVPGLRREENQPPLAELALRLSLSTYDSWDEVGRWYWGLVRDQLTPDESLREVVRELTEGLSDPADRVRAVHGWVVEHTRYVALEFGIHGYQPYRVTQIVDRGFGDCKDKASLLVTMLGLAGVEASMVLLRTRLAGRVPPRPPGLSMFDHAIAYVPSLDLFLDGTAEQSGTREMPWMDQGVTALLVSQEGIARLVTTPIDDPSRNVTRQEIHAVVPADLRRPPLLTTRETIVGSAAARLRYHFQSKALRRERLEARISGAWPGAKLLDHRFLDVSDRERPVELEARLEAPSVVIESEGRRAVELACARELTRRWARRSERRTALELRTPPHIEQEARVTEIPQGWQVVELPPPVELRSAFGSLELSSQRVGREVRTSLRLVMSRDRVEPAEYPAFRRFCQEVDRAILRRLVLARGSGAGD